MIKAYVVDDEPLAVERLARMLKSTGRVDVAGSSSDPEAALAWLRENRVDVLFLDIQMPGLTGFELLDRLDRDLPVVFTTAYDRYAIDAFDVNSVAYLLKPIDPDRLARALDKIERAGRPDVRVLAREIAEALRQRAAAGAPGAPTGRLERIASKVGDRTTLLEVSRVTHFAARDKLTFAVVNGREHIVDFTLAELEQKLDPRRFVRIHRATIVNAGFIQELFPAIDSGVVLRLRDDARTELPVARDRVRELKARLGI